MATGSQQITETGNQIECEFKWTYNYLYHERYTCVIMNQNVPECSELIFNGQHPDRYGNNDVLTIKFHLCNVTKVPQGLTKIFPNLEALIITVSNLKTINKEDLIEYKKLKSIDFSGNPIEFLPDDLFEGFNSLEKVSFNSCNLSLIEPGIFRNLYNLRLVCLTGNPNYDFFMMEKFDDDDYYEGKRSNEAYEDLKRYLYEKYYSKLKSKQDWGKSNKNLHQDVHELTEKLRNQAVLNSLTSNQQKNKNEELGRNIEKLQADLQKEETQLIENFHQQHQKFKELSEIFKNEVQNFKSSEEKLQRKLQNAELSAQNTFNADVKTLAQDETFKDFKIIIDDREFPVHKFLLAARSPTLAEMLRNNPEAENLKLVDISVEIFELVLNFLYTDELPNEDGTNFLHLFAAAGRLGINELKNFAAIKLIDVMSDENSLEILNLSNKYDHDELRQKAYDNVKKIYPKIKFNDEWIEDGEKVSKVIKAFVAKEELVKKAEEEFKNLFM